MKFKSTLLTAATISILIACGGGNQEEEKKEASKPTSMVQTETKTETAQPVEEIEEDVPPSQRIDLESKGVGPIKSVDLPDEIDQEMAAKGKEIYNSKCTACHKVDKTLIGPAPKDILKRRTPEWVMNMILNPDGMVKEDALAKELFLQFNGSPMSNQNLTEEEARSILEYMRTL